MPYQVINKMNQWGERTKREEYGRKLTFLNRTKEKYNWDNNELKQEEGLQTEPEPTVEEETTSESEQATEVAQNANLVYESNTTKAPELLNEVIYISDDKVEDLTSYTKKIDETRTDETIKTEIDRINNE